MGAIFESESTLTDRYQTTVPEAVRRVLKLTKRDKLRYSIRPGGEVVLTRAGIQEENDPVLGRFLDFLAADMAAHPERLKAVDSGLVQRMAHLVDKVHIDLNSALTDEDE